MALRSKHADEQDPAGDHEQRQRALFQYQLAGRDRRRFDRQRAFGDTVRDGVCGHATNPLAYPIVGERDERNQHDGGGRRQHEVSKVHRKPLSQLPFRPATEIGSRAFLRFSRRRAPRSDRPPGGARTKRAAALTKLHLRCCEEPRSHFRGVPLRNTHLPTISAARFTNLNRATPIRPDRASLYLDRRVRKTPGEQRLDWAFGTRLRRRGTAVALVRWRRRGCADA